MEDNEDEPEDVRKATPVAGAIKSGSKDEKAGGPKATGKKKDPAKPSRCDKNAKQPTPAKSEADCCRGRIGKESKTPKVMPVLVYSPPCTLPRLEIIPRHCLSKQEYIDVLASPSRKCPPPCLGKTVIRKIRPISARMNELAQPARRLIVGTLQERGETLPPEMVENLVKSIEGSACMTPEQAEKYFRDKEREKEKKAPKTARQKCRGKPKPQCPSQLDREAVMCQYLMAERFVKSIISWKCPIPVEEFKDIASVILRRLSFVLEYTPTDGEDLKSQQMRFLADIIACWISGVLFEVAEEHKKEIEEEIAAEEEEDEEEDEGPEEEPEQQIKSLEEDDDEDDGEKDKGQEVVHEKKEKVETQEIGTQTEDSLTSSTDDGQTTVKLEPGDGNEEAEKEKARIEAENQRKAEEEEKARIEAEKKRLRELEEQAENEAKQKAKLQEEQRKKEAEEEEERKRREEEEKRRREQEEEEEKRRKKQEEEEAEELKRRQKEEEERLKKEAELEKKRAEEARLKELGPKDAIARIGDGELFKTDLPFVTFGKILDTVYKMLEDEPEGDETDPIHNRIQRALYEKLASVVELERAGALTENLKDVVDVLSGKIATWIKELLKDTELNFLRTHPPEVESREIRDWGKWIDQVTDRAGDWAEWIHRVVKEAEDHREKSADLKRGDWQSWTSDTETNALLWRRYYLETVHQAHHNKMMLVDRPVVKTGEKHVYSTVEEEIENTDLGNA